MNPALRLCGWLAVIGCATGSPPKDSDMVEDSRESLETDDGSTDTDDTDTAPIVAYNACTAPEGVRASGGWEDPIEVQPPFVDRNDTTGVPSDASAYDCAAETGETGGELIYALTLDVESRVWIEVLESEGVDVDVHLLQDPEIVDTMVEGCLQRDNRHIERVLPPGEYRIAVDTWSNANGESSEGRYTLGIEAWPEGWTETALPDGVIWSHLDQRVGTPQRIDVLEFEPAEFELAPVRHDGCEPVPTVADREDFTYGMNAGFFTGQCGSQDLVRRDGQTYSTNSLVSTQRTMVWDDGAVPSFRWLDAGEDVTDRANGLGSYPSLVSDGALAVDPPGTSSFFTSRHPRTGIAITPNGRTLWVAVDGRNDAASGFTMTEFAELMADLEASEAVNLDGGGSTSLYVRDCSVNGVVNHPSDGGGTDHFGLRSVADGIYAAKVPFESR